MSVRVYVRSECEHVVSVRVYVVSVRVYVVSVGDVQC